MRHLHDVFSRIGAEFPERIAVRTLDSGEAFSYAVTLRDAAQVSKSIHCGETIALLCKRTALSVVILQAASIAGASLLPLACWSEACASGMKREAWEASVKYALTEGNVRVLVSDDVIDDFLADIIESQGIITSNTGEFPTRTAESGNEEERSEILLKLLSGGSTGNPKLHMITHAMMLSEHKNYRYIMGRLGIETQWTVLQQSPAVWPASQYGQVNIALALAGALVISSETSPEGLAREIETHAVNVVGGAPSQLSLVSEFLGGETSAVKVIFSWGETLNPLLAKRLKTTLPYAKIVELLVATEYWLCMFSADGSGSFETVPDCEVTAEDVDGHGVGQLRIAGPMVLGGSLTTQDLIRISDENRRIEFLGRKDFMTKIGANWFDVREIEDQLVEAGQWVTPRISECVVVTHKNKLSLVVSVEQETLPCDIALWLSEVRGIVSRLSPVPLEIRVLAAPLPRTAARKIDRKGIISLIELGLCNTHVAADKGKSRFRKEFFSQAKWASLFALVLGPDSLWAPFMYLATLYLPRSDYLPRSKVYSYLASLLNKFTETLRKDMPFGVSGAIVLLSLMRSQSRVANSIFRIWTLAGIALALQGNRLLSWPLAFWTGAGAAVRNDCSYWTTVRKWRRMLDSFLICVGSIPDIFLGTDLCHPFDENRRTFVSSATTQPREEKAESETQTPQESYATLEEVSDEDNWWNKSPVEYIRMRGEWGLTMDKSVSKPDLCPVFEGESLEVFVLNTFRGVISNTGLESSLKGLSSLQITELVQRLRMRVVSASARTLMDSANVKELVDSLEKSLSTEKLNESGGKYAKIQFSPGQVNRPCRWMIRTQSRPFDRQKLLVALNRLTDRHALLRSELADPKPFHSFLYDGAVMVVNSKRFFDGKNTFVSLFARAVHASWVRLRIHPPGALPRHWVDVLTSSSVSDFESLRRSIMSAKRELEECWNTHQRPLTAHIYSLPDGTEFLMLSVKHSVSDGNSAFPLIDELAQLYDEKDLLPAPMDPVPELEARLKAGILCDDSSPNRTSLRTQLFYSNSTENAGGGYYRHYLCLEKSAVQALLGVSRSVFEIGFDAALLSVILLGLMRADKSLKETITLYCPMRDGEGESGFIGLLADWRDLTIQIVPGASLMDVFWQVSEKIKKRQWEPTLSPAGPESLLLNWLAFDGTPRLDDASWEPYHVDKVTTRWNRMDRRDFDLSATPSGRFRSMSLEQYEAGGEWWLRVDVAANLFPPKWMMSFSKAVNDCFGEILNNPLCPAVFD